MASSYSPLLRLELMATGENNTLWGNITNTNLATVLEQAIAGTAEISITGSGGSVTLTESNGGADESREAILRITGTYTGPVNIVAPAVSKIYLIINDSSQDIVLKTAASTGVTVGAGTKGFLVYNTGAADFQLVASGGGSGTPLNVPDTLVQRGSSGEFAAGNITATGLISAKLQAYKEHMPVNGSTVSGAVNIDLSQGNIFYYVLGGTTTFTFTNPPASGVSAPCTVILQQDATGSRTATFTGAKYTDSQAPVLTTTPNRYDVLTFFTIDGGVSYFGTFAMANVT